MTYFDDIKTGDRRDLGRFTFTTENIKEFAHKFDPQRFHLDEEAGRKVFGGLAASGWHVTAGWMKVMVADLQRDAASRGEPCEPVVSPGFRNLKWLKPVLAGDTVLYQSEVMSTRISEKRPDWGLVQSLNTGTNQHGVLVFSFEATVFLTRRPGDLQNPPSFQPRQSQHDHGEAEENEKPNQNR